VLLVIKVKALALDVFKLVVLCVEHVDVSYDSGVPKMVKSIVYNKLRGTAGVEDGVVSVLDTWVMEVGGRVRVCMEGVP